MCRAGFELLGSRNPPTSTPGAAEINQWSLPRLTTPVISLRITQKVRTKRPTEVLSGQSFVSKVSGIEVFRVDTLPTQSTLLCHCHYEQMHFHELPLRRYILSPRRDSLGHRSHSEHGCVQVLVCCHLQFLTKTVEKLVGPL